jgi:hypothetical protein
MDGESLHRVKKTYLFTSQPFISETHFTKSAEDHFYLVGSSHIEGGLNMGLLFQALRNTINLSLSTNVAHLKTVLPYY